jgi:putative transposase
MGKPRKYNGLSEEKRNIIGQLVEMYDIKTAAEIQEALKDLLGGTIQNMLDAELDTQMQGRSEAEPDYSDSRNGHKPKTLKSSMGEISISVPQDRNSDFEPQIVPKYTWDISEIEGKIISMYTRGFSVRQISDQIKEIYGFDVSEGMVTAITNKLLPEIEAWQKRPLATVYPIVFIDAIVFNVRDNSVIRKTAAYVVMGIKEAISAAYPMTEHQRCIVHVVRNTLKYVAEKDKKAFANDLKTIYHAPDEQTGYVRMKEVAEVWNRKYPGVMNRWEDNWDVISPMFKFSESARKVLYTTNAIESLNSGFRRLNRSRSVFPNDMSLLKALYLASHELTKKWTMPVRNWGTVYAELAIMYPGRLSGT